MDQLTRPIGTGTSAATMVENQRGVGPPRRAETATAAPPRRADAPADARYADSGHATERAVAASLLAELPPPLRERVLAGAVPLRVPAGGTIYDDEDDPRCALVLSGLVRVVLSAPDGRTVTVRYARSGELLGVPIVVGGPIPASVQMVTDGKLLMLDTGALRRLAQTEPAVAWLLARETAQRFSDTLGAVADNAFGSLRQRVARHLLDLAGRRRDGQLVAIVTQQELAQAVGSARPAVARVVGDLREAGLIATAPRAIEVRDPERLCAETWSRRLSPM